MRLGLLVLPCDTYKLQGGELDNCLVALTSVCERWAGAGGLEVELSGARRVVFFKRPAVRWRLESADSLHKISPLEV